MTNDLLAIIYYIFIFINIHNWYLIFDVLNKNFLHQNAILKSNYSTILG